MAFKCSCCNEMHDERPAFTFKRPDAYHALSEEEKIAYQAECNSDFCIIRYPEQTDYFVRVCLDIPIIDEDEPFAYGVWVSLSKTSFTEYQAHANDTAEQFEQKEYFGWLSNHIPNYEWDNIPFKVVTQPEMRPSIYPDPDFDHDLVRDFYQGISSAEADKRLHEAFGNF